MAQKIRGFWFRLCGFLLATFCVVGAGKTAYASCSVSEESKCKDCCDKLKSLEESDSTYNKYKCVEYRGNCYLRGQGPGDEATYLTDEAGKFYYKTQVYCASDGKWATSS